jgi:peptidoglycan/xylan/chitin deacetylase (PgdA/CDA1 family)
VRRALRVLAVPLSRILARALRLSGRRRGIALVYHGVAAVTGDPEVELVPSHGVELLEAQIRYVARTYRVVPAADLQQAVAERRRGERFPVAITFDDDLASHVELALPILRRLGVTATFCLTGATLDGPSSFWWQQLQQAVDASPGRLADFFAALGAPRAEPPRRAVHELAGMIEKLEPAARDAFAKTLPDAAATADSGVSADGVRALVDAGMTIGLHTWRHDPLPPLDDRALAAAFSEGRDELEEVAGQRLVVVAYPHGRADERVSTAARHAGLRIGYTGVPRPVQATDDPLRLGRLTPSYRSARHLGVQMVAALCVRRRRGCGDRARTCP